MDQLEQLPGAGSPFPPRQMTERGGHIVEGGEVREERVALEHEARPASVSWHPDAGLAVEPSLTINPDRSILRTIQPSDRPQDRGLAAARGPDQGEHLARRTGERCGERDRRVLHQADREAAADLSRAAGRPAARAHR